ncbi:MAG: DUF1854 domain-containing protein [Pseudomonadota bacterium]
MSGVLTDVCLYENAFGRLVFTDATGVAHEGVIPVRAFPLSAPEDGLALVNKAGQVLAWFEHWADLPEGVRLSLEAALAKRELMPVIARIKHVSSFATPSTWTVLTDRGETQFVLKGEEDIRRLDANALLITDRHGVHFLIRERLALDSHSRKILDRFL